MAAATQVNEKTYSFDTVIKSDFQSALLVCSGMEKEKRIFVWHADSHIFRQGQIISALGIPLLPFFWCFQGNI